MTVLGGCCGQPLVDRRDVDAGRQRQRGQRGPRLQQEQAAEPHGHGAPQPAAPVHARQARQRPGHAEAGEHAQPERQQREDARGDAHGLGAGHELVDQHVGQRDRRAAGVGRHELGTEREHEGDRGEQGVEAGGARAGAAAAQPPGRPGAQARQDRQHQAGEEAALPRPVAGVGEGRQQRAIERVAGVDGEVALQGRGVALDVPKLAVEAPVLAREIAQRDRQDRHGGQRQAAAEARPERAIQPPLGPRVEDEEEGDRADHIEGQVVRRQGLQGEEPGERRRPAPGGLLPEPVQQQQHERQPLEVQDRHVRQVRHAEEAERIGDARHQPGRAAAGKLAHEQPGAIAAEHERQQRDEVIAEDRVAGEPEDRRSQQRGRKVDLPERERQGEGVHDVRIEQVDGVGNQRVGFPGHLVGRGQRVAVVDAGPPGGTRERPGHDHGEGREERQDAQVQAQGMPRRGRGCGCGARGSPRRGRRARLHMLPDHHPPIVP